MTTLATREATNGLPQPSHIDAATMEKVVVAGDLSKLTSAERLSWYKGRCEAAGLDPRTQPFQYLSLQGKLTLYATKGATDQLIGLHKLTVVIVERTHLESLGIYEVQCRVTFPDGRHVEDVAALSIRGLQGEALCNAIMKVVTKAKRRTVLSACGLGMLDESEVETIPGARVTAEAGSDDSHHARHHDNRTGHGSGAYAAPADVERYRAWLRDFVEGVNAKWLDRWTDEHGQINPDVRELTNAWQVSGHLVKWAVDAELIHAPDDPKQRQKDPLAAVAWVRERARTEAEATRYARQIWKERTVKLLPPEPEDVTQAPAEDDGDPDIDFADMPEEPGSDG